MEGDVPVFVAAGVGASILALILKRHFSKREIKEVIPDHFASGLSEYSKATRLLWAGTLGAAAQLCLYLSFAFLLPVMLHPTNWGPVFGPGFLCFIGAAVVLSYCTIIMCVIVKCDSCGKRMLVTSLSKPKYIGEGTGNNYVKLAYRIFMVKRHTCIYCGQKYDLTKRGTT